MTENATPSYRSVILTLDHTTQIEEAIVQKAVYSTQTLEESMVALLRYYGEESFLQSIETIRQFQQIAISQFPAVVYRTKENTQIVLSQGTLDALMARSAHLADCHQFILETAGDVVSKLDAAQKDVTPLIVFDWSVAAQPSDPRTPQEEAPEEEA